MTALVRDVAIDAIRADAAAQPREHISTDIVAAYADDLGRGATFPPLVVFKEGETFWLADGFHRLSAARGVMRAIACEIHKGGLREAILYSCGANSEHGHRRTNEDKRRAVLKLLDDREWSKWSDREIAERAKVGNSMVSKLRAESSLSAEHSEPRKFVSKHGTVAKMTPRKIQASSDKNTPSKGDAQPAEHEPERNARGQYGWLCRAIWEIEKNIEALPAPEMAAQLFPVAYRGTVTAEKIAQQAAWLTAFGEAWQRQHGEAA